MGREARVALVLAALSMAMAVAAEWSIHQLGGEHKS
jgi:hypothetical protein